MESAHRVRAAFVLIGFTSAVAQIVLMRELMALFYGNEISIGLTLASWLCWTAAGSAIAGRLVRRLRDAAPAVGALFALAALAVPATILAVRAAKGALQTVPGESLGPGAMLTASLVLLGPFCIVSGSLFAAGSRLWEDRSASPTALATGSVYLLEALGSATGGVLAGLVLIRWISPLAIALLVAALNLTAAAALIVPHRAARRAAIGVVLLGCGILALPFGAARLEALSLARFWKGYRVVAARNSPYGSLAVVEAEGNRSVYENGVNLFNVPDPAAAEEAVHFALLEHPEPHTLLMIGGGVNGSLAQAFEHRSLQRVDYVELDPAVIGIARQVFPASWAPLAADPRVHIHVTDGRLYLKTTRAAFDVIIVSAPDPQTAQLNRFYTLEFFREASSRLTPGGLLSFQLTASENYISPDLADFLRSIRATLGAVFPYVGTMPGETVHFFAARRPGVLALSSAELLSRLRARHLETSYVREYYIPFRLTPDRVADLESQIAPLPATPLNRDFAPIAYYFDIALWSGRFHARYREFFRALAGLPFGQVAAIVAAALAALSAAIRFQRSRARRLRGTAAFATGALGFTLIGLEMLLLLAFQAIYGYVYQQLALVIAAFMAGMALGSWRALSGSQNRVRLEVPMGRNHATAPEDSTIPSTSGAPSKTTGPCGADFSPRGTSVPLWAGLHLLRWRHAPSRTGPWPAAAPWSAFGGAGWRARRSPRGRPGWRSAPPEEMETGRGGTEVPRGLKSAPQLMPALAGLGLLAALAPLLLYALLAATTRASGSAGMSWLSQLLFPASALVCGLLGGYQFPIASRVFFSGAHPGGPGTLYAIDLAGSCLGAVLFSAWLIPVFGFFRTAVLTAMVNLAPALLSFFPGSGPEPPD